VTERFGRHCKRFADRLVALMLLLPPLLVASASPAQSTAAATAAPAKLHADTVAAFDRYEHLTEERNETELKRGSALLWIDSCRFAS
jgi:hypothetical protein